MESNSIDSVVTDPPYGLKFMGKKWDYDVPSVEVWKECLRVLKPGGHMLVACGTRTQHRMAVNIEDAGFEIRDVITWLYGSGFPKSMNVSIAIDKAAGVMGARGKAFVTAGAGERKDIQNTSGWETDPGHNGITDAAKQWQGWGTALKPACEFWTLCRKPLEGTVAENVQKYGTGGLNIDGCRVGTDERTYKGMSANKPEVGTFRDDNWVPKDISVTVQGRFPANLILDEEAGAMLDEQSGVLKSNPGTYRREKREGDGNTYKLEGKGVTSLGDSGGASRFFYCAKASKSERNAGLEGMPERRGGSEQFDSRWKEGTGEDRMPMTKNHHPTVKPIKLMSYLCRLITPPNGIVLDPFMGSGSTGVAAKQEGFEFIGIELDAEYLKIAEKRIINCVQQILI